MEIDQVQFHIAMLFFFGFCFSKFVFLFCFLSFRFIFVRFNSCLGEEAIGESSGQDCGQYCGESANLCERHPHPLRGRDQQQGAVLVWRDNRPRVLRVVQQHVREGLS
jgi:hypothetical protein